METEEEKDQNNAESKGHSISINSVDGIAWVAERWGEIELLVSILSLKVQELTHEEYLPKNFIIDSTAKSVILVYPDERTRRIPLEVLLVMDNEQMFNSLVEIYLQLMDPKLD